MSLLRVSIFIFLLQPVLNVCTSNSLLFGCLSCTAGEQLATQLLPNNTVIRICTTIENCTTVNSNDPTRCTACTPGSIVPTDDPARCVFKQGCATGTILSCTACNTGYTLTPANTCLLFNSPYCWQLNASGCQLCPQIYFTPTNCSINATLCSQFDYTLWACVQCPPNTVLHSSGLYCVTADALCLSYTLDRCQACVPGHYVQNQLCTYTPGLYYYQGTPNVLSKCIRSDQVFDTTTLQCTTITNHCAVANGAQCSQCVVQYYLSAGSCLRCSIANCLDCNSTTCLVCTPGHYLPNCTKCTNCPHCSAADQCLNCNVGFILFEGSCIQCSNGSSFDINTRQCLPCSDANCQYCLYVGTALQACAWCTPPYVLSGVCALGSALTPTNGVESLSKQLSINSTLVYNDEALLISRCTASSNGFQCQCNKTTHTSVCTSIPTINAAFPSLTFRQFQQQINYQRLLSELPSYTLDLSFAPTDVLSINDFVSFVQTVANTVNRVNNLTLVSQLATFARINMLNVFDETQTTVLYGLGYYLKYRPNPTVTDNTLVVSTNLTTASQFPQLSLVFFNTNGTILTGTVLIFTTTVQRMAVSLKTVNPLPNNKGVKLYSNNTATNTTVTLSEGYAQFQMTSNWNYYSLRPTELSALNSDPFAAYRVENVLLQDAYIYILVFLTLYLVLLPLCAMVDLVESRSTMRKNGRVSDEETEVIKINYKDFFPLYNIANSERSARLKKVCLYIVNMEHGVTFLSLMYFRLGAGQSIVAVALGIPAYACTVAMSYACGAVVRKAEQRVAYLLNVLTVAYWAVWVAVMPQFAAAEYKPFIYFFLPVFLFLDLLADLLETLLVYFAISQDQQQILLFNRLAKWLTWKGYYEFNALAKQLQARDYA